MKLILATKNEHKVEEFQRILAPLGWQVIPQDAICPDLEIEETGTTFAENAYLKAMGIYRATGLPTVADDSGLCVDALGGAPVSTLCLLPYPLQQTIPHRHWKHLPLTQLALKSYPYQTVLPCIR